MKQRVVVISLASDFGCQVQMTNFPELLDMVDTIDLQYWQLATSGDMPEEYDVAVLEGAVTTDEHVEILEEVAKKASVVITVGACAHTGGVPAMAQLKDLETQVEDVYGKEALSYIAPGRLVPRPIKEFINVDFEVLGCPIDPEEFSFTLQRALLGLKDRKHRDTLCAECKINENPCFYMSKTLCLGLVTTTGCGSFCVNRGRPCTGCRGLAIDANMDAARGFVRKYGLSDEFERALEIYNTNGLGGRVK